MPHLILIRGASGAGKSTLAKMLSDWYYWRGYEVTALEADDYFMKTGSYQFDATRLGIAHANCLEAASKAMARRGIVIVSNTFTKKKEMLPYIEKAKELGLAIQVIVCQGNFENKHGVTQEKVAKQRARMQYDISDLLE